ncbi:MAG: DUF4252 domain-containing protein [Saprospiraceae bacterium]|nr:DUF4252 domain-containing protein [Saprospiraceae bacterium]
MKNSFLLYLLLTLSLSSFAQGSIDDVFTKYEGDSQFRIVNVSKTMFKLMAKSEKVAADPDLMQVISDLEGMRVLVKETGGVPFFDQIVPSLAQAYDPLMSVQEDGENIQMYIQEGNEHIEQFIAAAHNQEQFVLIHLQGKIDLENISKLSTALDAPGLKYLERVKQ